MTTALQTHNIEAIENSLTEQFTEITQVERAVYQRVLDGFITHQVNEQHFYTVNGYAHDDMGREVLDKVYAYALQSEAALVRPHFVSGTHTIATALRGVCQPGNTLLSLTGRPYDTLEETLGTRGSSTQSLKAWGVNYQEIDPFNTNGQLELDDVESSTINKIVEADILYIQRSCGYHPTRATLTIAELKQLISWAKKANPNAPVLVDNCYGEFVELDEPTSIGADLIMGSLIKNPGGGLAPTGGYIAGKANLITQCAEALTAPGVGSDGGMMFNLTHTMLQGLLQAPTAVANALKTMVLVACLFEANGYTVSPVAAAKRGDIIQRIALGTPEKLQTFCEVLQHNSPIDSHLTPIAEKLPGYADPVIMAGGTFVQGSTIELSADGPMREPYTVYLQGGTNYTHGRLVMSRLLEQLNKLNS